MAWSNWGSYAPWIQTEIIMFRHRTGVLTFKYTEIIMFLTGLIFNMAVVLNSGFRHSTWAHLQKLLVSKFSLIINKPALSTPEWRLTIIDKWVGFHTIMAHADALASRSFQTPLSMWLERWRQRTRHRSRDTWGFLSRLWHSVVTKQGSRRAYGKRPCR